METFEKLAFTVLSLVVLILGIMFFSVLPSMLKQGMCGFKGGFYSVLEERCYKSYENWKETF